MNETNNVEELITALYDMIQDARALPLGADKCIVERDRVLDMLDEISSQLPASLKQARTIVESRNELVNQARREAESIIRQAQAQAKMLVSQEGVYLEAKKQSEAMIEQAQARIAQLKQVSNAYVGDSLLRAEEAISQALSDIRLTRSRFQSVTEDQPAQDEEENNEEV
jgi:F0F1-type ATP synthase membrane subunit b/b'